MASQPPTNSSFPSTDWTELSRVDGTASQDAQQALSSVLNRYLPALRAYLVRQRHLSADHADELLQGFVVSRILERQLMARADPQRGRFRSLLLISLNRYLINHVRDEKRAKRYPKFGHLQSLEEASETLADAAQPSDIFDIAWAREVIVEAMQRMHAECEVRGRSDLWALFDGRVIGPTIRAETPVPYAQLVQQYGFRTPAEATNALVTAKRLFVRMLCQTVAQYERTDADVEDEIRDLQAILAKSRKIPSEPV